MILIDCSGGRTLVFHLKMTGQLWMCRPSLPHDKHTHFIISFRGTGRELRFRDVRKFGFVLGLRTADVVRARELSGLGPEPLELDRNSFYQLFAGRRGRLKSLLLNQKIIAGIGNIYADEILFAARLHPRAEASRLRRRELDRLGTAVPLILEKAIRFKGTSVRDYRDGDGLEGLFQNYLRVYGREEQPCPRCGAKIRRIRIAGRSSFFCPLCQKAARQS
jgi:formamidopyrimidine-DNA glycosylase